MPLRKHLHPRDAGDWPPDHGPRTRRPIAQPESTGPFLTVLEDPSELELLVEDMHARAITWQHLARSLATALLVPQDRLDTAANSLTTIALLPDVSPRYRSWLHGRVLADLLGRRRPPKFRPNAPTPTPRPQLVHIELTTVGPGDTSAPPLSRQRLRRTDQAPPTRGRSDPDGPSAPLA